MLEEGITETAWAAWQARFDQLAVAYKLSDKNIENRVFECILNSLADQIVVHLKGNKNKEALLVEIKAAVAKKRSVFLYSKDFHKLSLGRGENPERYAARIKQAAPACSFTTHSGTANYGPDLMSSIFILGLEDVYMHKQLFQLWPEGGKTTANFNKLVSAASEIATAKDNCAAALNTNICGVSGDQNNAKRTLKR